MTRWRRSADFDGIIICTRSAGHSAPILAASELAAKAFPVRMLSKERANSLA